MGLCAYDHFGTGFPDTPLGLQAWRTQSPATLLEPQWKKAICEILAAQTVVAGQSSTTTGRWGYFGTAEFSSPPTALTAAAIIPTSLNLLELIAYANSLNQGPNVYVDCNTIPTYPIGTIITNGVAWLASTKNTDNGFGVAGSTVLETAHVYKALVGLAPTNAAKTFAEDYLVNQVSTSQGGWGSGGVSNSLVTAMALSVLPQPSAAVVLDSDGDGIPNVVETLMGKNVNVPDANLPRGGNTVQTPGHQFPGPLLRNLSFSFATAASGGNGPYTWRVSAGTLPLGMSLDPGTGVISGKPTFASSYAFAITVTDGLGASVTRSYSVEVSAADGAAVLQIINSILLDDD